MKILHAIAALSPETGGPAKACLEMARAVARRGHEIAIFTTDLGAPAKPAVARERVVDRDGVSVHIFPVQLPKRWRASWPMGRALRRQIPGFDLVHLHSLYLFHDWVTGAVCRRHGVPYLVRPHGTLDPYIYRRHRLAKIVLEHAFQNRVLSRAAAIHYTTEEEKRLAAPYACGAPGVVVPLGLDLADYQRLPPPGSFRARHPEIGDKKIVLFFGRLNFKKGLDVLSEAFAQVARTREDVHLVIAGPDHGMRRKMESWVSARGMRARTTFAGMLLEEDKLAALGDSELFVLPSYSENFGLAVVEAMACGLPVVISDKVNIWREIEAAGAGRVGPPEAKAFARMIEEVLADPDGARRMGERGKALVGEKFAWDRIAVRLERVYDAILAGQALP